MKTFKLLAMAALMLGAAACTDFGEPIAPVDETNTTRALIDPTALRASAAVANPDNPYAVTEIEAFDSAANRKSNCAKHSYPPTPIHAAFT